MAKQYRKLRRKLKPRTAAPADKIQAQVKGKDYFLLGIIFFTMIVTTLGWKELDGINRLMYVLLTLALTLTYVRRQNKNLSERMKLFVERGSMLAIGLSLLLFIYNIYHQFGE